MSMQSERTITEAPEDPLPAPVSHVQEDLASLDFLLIIMQRKRLVGIVTAISAGIALILAFALSSEYTAKVTILPPQGSSLMSLMLANQMSEMNGAVSWRASSVPGMKNMNDMYVSLLRSQPVEDAVIQRYGLQSEFREKSIADTRKSLENHTTIDGATKDGLIRFSYTHRDPRRSAEIANGYVEEFKSSSQHLAITEASQWRVVFEKRLEKAKADLENANEALRTTQLSRSTVLVDPQALAVIESAARIRAQIVAKEVQIEAMRSYPGDDYPALAQAQTDLDELRTQFNKQAGSNQRLPDNVVLQKGVVPQSNLEYARRLRDVKDFEAIFGLLAQQLELAKLDEVRERTFFQVVEPATIPDRQSYPKRGLLVGAGVTVGFTFGIMLALLQGGLVRMRLNPTDKDKLELLKMSLWSGRQTRPNVKIKENAASEEELGSLRHAQTEATGPGF